MPPKNTKRSRSSSPTSESPKKCNVIGNRSAGPPKRSEETIIALNEKKTKDSIWEQVVPFERITKNSNFNPETMFKFITWNVAGLRGILKKDPQVLEKFLAKEKPDILALQETKLNPEDPENAKLGVVDGYTFIDNACSVKKGYSGTRTYVRQDTIGGPLLAKHTKGFCLLNDKKANEGDNEGRILSTFFDAPGTSKTLAGQHPNFVLVNTYVPNSGMTLDRLTYRTEEFDLEMRKYLTKLKKSCEENAELVKNTKKFHGVIWTGDLNVAERDFDRYFSGTFKTMQSCSGFTPEERVSFRATLKATDSVDTFRFLYPNAGPVYTFWSARLNGREKGLGWRLDYFVISSNLIPNVVDCFAMPEITNSDHSPVQLWLRKQ